MLLRFSPTLVRAEGMTPWDVSHRGRAWCCAAAHRTHKRIAKQATRACTYSTCASRCYRRMYVRMYLQTMGPVSASASAPGGRPEKIHNKSGGKSRRLVGSVSSARLLNRERSRPFFSFAVEGKGRRSASDGQHKLSIYIRTS